MKEGFRYKYNGYYPHGAEELAAYRDELRKQGRFAEADELRNEFPWRFGVDVLDTPFGYTFQWHDKSVD
jgi:cysteinyl-tRNA synthetase